MNLVTLRLAALVLAAGFVSTAAAQPVMIATPVSQDMGSTGDKVVGLIYEANIDQYVPYVWTRGAGFARIVAGHSSDTTLSCSDDASVLAMDLDNESDWGSVNCFAGYCFGTMTGCTPGAPLPAPSPCEIPSIAHRWTAGSGWVNAGSFPRTLDSGTGRYFGGTRCDYNVTYTNGISGNGRFLVGGAWYAQLNCTCGGPGYGMCGDFYGFRYDSVTGAFEQLAAQPGTHTSRADKVNTDGSVITGYDLALIDNGDGTTDSIRQTCVWRSGVETILDSYLGAKDNAAVNGPGTALVQGASAPFVSATFGQSGVRLVRWTFQGGAWTPENLGLPAPQLDINSGVPIACSDMWAYDVSDDGNTVVGLAAYSGVSRPFIWRPAINGGVPVDLQNYIAGVDPANPLADPNMALVYATNVSGDGNAILVQYQDNRNTCAAVGGQSLQTGGAGVLYLNGTACEAPRLALPPNDWHQDYDIRLGVAVNAFASGTWPLTYQWQHEDPASPGNWIDLTDDCAGFPSSDVYPWHYEGTGTRQLRIGTGEQGADRAGRYRVIVSNSCGSVTSDPGTITFLVGACCTAGSCSIMYANDCAAAGGTYSGNGTTCAHGCSVCGTADFNCDGDVGTDADIEGFFACLSGTCPAAPCTNSADFNGDGDVGTDGDIEAFFRVLGGGNC